MYLDLDNNKLYFAKNGTIQNSGTGISITDPASTPNGVYFIAVGDGTSTNSSIWEVGFGNPSYGVSSANADPNCCPPHDPRPQPVEATSTAGPTG